MPKSVKTPVTGGGYPPDEVFLTLTPDNKLTVKKQIVPTVLVAAYNAREEIKKIADFVCSGSNDDLVIEQAINSLPPSGGRVVLSEGDFILGSSIDILRSNVTLEGQGAGTVIRGAIDTDYIRVGNGATDLSNIRITNLSIDGTGQTNWGGIYFYGGSGRLITNSIIENCWIKNNYYYGIYLNYTNNVSITNNIISYGDGSCVLVRNSSNCLISNNKTFNNNGYGIFVDQSDSIVVSNNISRSNGRDGILLTYSVKYSVVSNNIVGGNARYGIGVWYKNSYNTISNNVCYLNNQAGIALYSSDNNFNEIVGNVLINNSQEADNTYDDIYIYSSKYNIISSNIMIATATNRTRYAVNEAGTSDYNLIIGNISYGQATGNYNKVGANTLVVNNI